MVIYVVFDVGPGASEGETVEININNPSADVLVDSGSVEPATTVAISGTTTLSNCTFACAHKITIDHNKVGVDNNPGSLTDFPVLIDFVDTDLRSVPNGGKVQNPSGYDIVFRDSDGVTPLDHEIENYDPLGGRLIAWVRVPTLPKDVDRVIYMFLGSSCITSSQENVAAVWDSNFKGVWHVNDDFADSSTYDNDGTNFGSTDAPGQISNGQDFDGIDDSIDLNNLGSSLNVGQDFTVSAWVQRRNTGTQHTILSKNTSAFYSWRVAFQADTLAFYVLDSTQGFDWVTGATVTDSNWHHVVARSDGAELRVFLDGVRHTNVSPVTRTIDYTANRLFAGVSQWSGSPIDYHDGGLDELRVSDAALSDDWIATEYNNQANPGSFASLAAPVELTLTDHDVGQVGDRFVGLTPVTDALFAFKLEGSVAATVDSVRVHFTISNGVDSSDISGGELWRDQNADGLIDGGDTPIQLGVNPLGDVLLFTSDFPLDVAGASYLVRATVSNLVLNDTTTFSLGVEDIETLGVDTCHSGSTASAVHTQDATPMLTLADHDSGQIPDQFLTSSPVFSELFAFKLTSSGAATVNEIRVRFTTGSGVVDGDVSNGELYRDNNDDGLIDGGDFLVQGGVTPVGGVLAFTGLSETPVGTIQYLVRANVSNLVPGDTTTFSLNLSDIDELEGGVTETGGTSDAVHTQDSASGGDVFYSVGTDTSDLETGTPVIDIVNGTAYLSVSQTGNIGVGDEIDYGAGIKAYIKDVVTPNQFVVHRPNGSIPGDVSGLPINGIRRAFNDLVSAEANSSDSFHLNSADLTASGANANLTWVCYNDTDPLTVGTSLTVTIDGYITDPTHRLTLTAAHASQVASGVSQRHQGVAGTGARLVATGNDGPMLSILDDYVTVEWLELDGGSESGVTRRYGIRATGPITKITLRGLVLHDFEQNVSAAGISLDRASPAYVYNNFVYDVRSSGGPAYGIADENNSTAGVFVYNNTVFNVTNSGSPANTYGIVVPDADDREVKNNIVIGTFSAAGSWQDYCLHSGTLGTDEICHTSGTPPVTASLHTNMSSDNTAVDTDFFGSSITGETSGEFKIAVNDAEDLHLESDADAVGAGHNMGGLVVSDIDGQPRPVGAWEMGADEASSSWFGGGWGVRRQITIDNSGRGELLEFPMLLCLDGSTIDYDKVQANGEDLRFLDKDNATVLPHEIEEWNPGGISYVWVNVAQIDANSASDFIYLYYDNSGASSGEQPTEVWRNQFQSVYHLHDDFADSSGTNLTPGANNGSSDGTTNKLAGDHQTFVTGDYIDLNWAPFYSDGQNFTWEGWVRVGSIESTDALLGIEDRFGGTGDASEISIGVRETLAGTNPVETFNHIIRPNVTPPPLYSNADPVTLDTNWHYLVLVRDGITGRSYLDGMEVHSAGVGADALDFPTRSPWSATTNTLLIGAQWETDLTDGSLHNFFQGDIDEVRTSMAARSADWIEAQFESTSCDMFTVGGEVQATAVELLDFQARAGDAAVELTWETGSEIDNVGFYLYRALSADGPFELVNESVIPGLGSSPLGARYRYVDSGLANGTTYFYELEDLESTGIRERHGPVSATPEVGASFELPAGDDSEDGPSYDPSITYGDPEATSIQVTQLSSRDVLIELHTEGFYATPQEDGSVLLEVPGFLEASVHGEPGLPAIPIKQAWVQALAGKNVRIVSVKATDVESFSLRPSSAEILEPVMTPRGEVRLARRASNPARAFRSQGLYPEDPARLASVAFQQELKKALVELAPLRWDSATGQLLLARRLVVRLRFEGRATGELSLGGARGKKHRPHQDAGNIVAQLVTQQSGLYGLPFEDLFGGGRSIKTTELRLTYQGEPVPYYVLPNPKRFARGSVLYFLSRGESLNPYGRQAVFELAVGGKGETMTLLQADPSAPNLSHYQKTLELEENHLFQGRLTTAPDVWLWEPLLAPGVNAYPFHITDLAPVSESARLRLWIQGTTDLDVEPDHHLRVYLNGTLLDDFTLEGELAWQGDSELLPGVLLEGENLLEIENVGDTGAAYSQVMLNRFELTYPRQTVLEAGSLEGVFASGVAEVAGLTGAPIVVDTTDSPRWLRQVELLDDTVRFQVEEGHRYLVADPTGILLPEVRQPLPVRLTTIRSGAEYVVIAPEAFLEAAWPLLELRASQGLSSFAVSTEQIFSEFGHGESRPDALRDFLEHAYHHWGIPPRYVVLLGDATFDFKDYLGWGVPNQVPSYPLKTAYIWTVSDPAYALVNGDDILPDLALGRLPAANLDEARVMVDKILAYESQGLGLHGRAVLIADQSDAAGDFEQHAHELAATLLNGHEVDKIFLAELGTAATHDAILQAFDDGASLMSFIGHGGMQLWNHNILRVGDVDSLAPQAQQPLLLTMNCLNGYFQFPLFDSLSESLLKAEDKGVIAAFSPSGLSLDGPAHLYHRLLLTELLHGGHATLGDAILAAQGKYVDAGGHLELLKIYHLLGDPALRLSNNP
jgi:hypothetical protein